MANNWYTNLFGNSAPADPSSFDYDTAAQKVQRQRAAAQALQSLGMQTNQGQFVKNGDFIGYAGGNTVGSTLAHLAAAALSIPASDAADNAQKQLGLDSQNAMAYALDPNNSPAAQRAAAAQTQKEADQANQREIERMNNSVQGGDYIDPQAQEQQGPATVQTSPVSMPSSSDFTPIPDAPAGVTPAAKKAIAKALATGSPAAPYNAAVPTGAPSQSVTGGPSTFGTGQNLSNTLAPQTNLPTGANGPLSSDDAALAAKMLGVPVAPNTSGTPQNAPQAAPAANSTSALPSIATQQPAAPQAAPQASAPPVQPQAPVQPLPPQAPSLEDRARAVGIDPTVPRGPGDPSLAQQVQEVEATQHQIANGVQPQTDSRSLVDQARAQANVNPSFADQMAMLQQLSRTGPMGQQLAQSMMQSQFSKDWGEIKNADGATIGVYNKRDPSQVMGFQGTNSGTKTMSTAMDMVKNTDYTNAAAMQRLNQNLVSMGQQPMSPQQVAGMQLSASDRVGNVMSINKAQGDLGNDIVTSKNNISSMQKAVNDAQQIVALSAKVGSKYPGISSLGQLWSQYASRDPDVEQLRQLYAQNTIEAAREALQGQGRLNKQEYGVFQEASPNMQTSPAAAARMVAPSLSLLQNKIDTENAILNERMRRYKALGGNPDAFGQGGDQGVAQAPQGVSTGRPQNNYNF